MQDKTAQITALKDYCGANRRRKPLFQEVAPFLLENQKRLLPQAIRTLSMVHQRESSGSDIQRSMQRSSQRIFGFIKMCINTPEFRSLAVSRLGLTFSGNTAHLDFEKLNEDAIFLLIQDIVKLCPSYGLFTSLEKGEAGLLMDRHFGSFEIESVKVHYKAPIVFGPNSRLGYYEISEERGNSINLDISYLSALACAISESYFTCLSGKTALENARNPIAKRSEDEPTTKVKKVSAMQALQSAVQARFIEDICMDTPQRSYLELLNRIARTTFTHEFTHLVDHVLGHLDPNAPETRVESEIKAYLFEMAYDEPLVTFMGLPDGTEDPKHPNSIAGGIIHGQIAEIGNLKENGKIRAKKVLGLMERVMERPDLLSEIAIEILYGRYGKTHLDSFPIKEIQQARAFTFTEGQLPVLEAFRHIDNARLARSFGVD